MTERPPRILSGIQPTGAGSHLGNYLGAVKRWASLQDGYDAFYFIPDLHAITTPHDAAVLRGRTLEAVAELLAAGVDPVRSTVFVQSHIPEHAQLAWVLSCLTGYGEATRMTQFKDKAARGELGAASVGLLTYPMLMAADILLYQADEVPVGDDQNQHVELTRDLAQRFNSRYGPVFTVPTPTVLAATARIADLADPTRKMSKSRPPAGTVYVNDPPATTRKKIMRAVTDAGSDVRVAEDKPGVSNLLRLLGALSGRSIAALEADFDGQGYGDLKKAVAAAVEAELEPVRERYAALLADPAHLAEVLVDGAARARSVAQETLARAYDAVGFLPPDGAKRW